MMRLDKTMRAWGSAGFEDALKQEVVQLAYDQLPLQQGLSFGNYVAASPITLIVHRTLDAGDRLQVHAGILYQSIIGGCSCADDPSSTSENNEYCTVRLDIDKVTAVATIILLDES